MYLCHRDCSLLLWHMYVLKKNFRILTNTTAEMKKIFYFYRILKTSEVNMKKPKNYYFTNWKMSKGKNTNQTLVTKYSKLSFRIFLVCFTMMKIYSWTITVLTTRSEYEPTDGFEATCLNLRLQSTFLYLQRNKEWRASGSSVYNIYNILINTNQKPIHTGTNHLSPGGSKSKSLYFSVWDTLLKLSFDRFIDFIFIN